MSLENILARLEQLKPRLREQAHEADRQGCLSAAVVRELIDLELFRLWIPRSCGGLELSLTEALRIYEAAGRIDGAIGWAVMIGAGGGLFAAWLDPTVASEVFAPGDAVIAGSGAPDGRAEEVPGGYRASGRWRYASGADYATAFTANCVITRNGVPVAGPDGAPLIRAMIFRPDQVAIDRTWNPIGMRATGSHDFEVKEVFVPAMRSFSVFTDAPQHSGALYRLPFGVLTELPVAFVGLGIARHALDAFAALARTKKSLYAESVLADDPLARTEYARGFACWSAWKTRLAELASQCWDRARAGAPLGAEQLAEITVCCAVAAAELHRAIGRLAGLSGMTAIAQEDEFSLAWRDLQTLLAHAALTPRRLNAAGGVLLVQR